MRHLFEKKVNTAPCSPDQVGECIDVTSLWVYAVLAVLAAFAIVLIVWLCGSGVADELHLFDVLSKKGGEG